MCISFQFERYLLGREDVIKMPIQINGKTKDILELNKTPDEEEILNFAKEKDKIKKLLENKKIVKKIYIPNKILSLVVK